jgi:hypothetical protein
MYMTLAIILGFAAVALFVGAFVMVARKKKALNVVSVSTGAVKSMPESKCPKCGSPMADGFLSIRGVARWREFNSAPGAFTNSGETISNFAQESTALKLTPGVPENIAKRCRQCALILVDHSKLYKVDR